MTEAQREGHRRANARWRAKNGRGVPRECTCCGVVFKPTYDHRKICPACSARDKKKATVKVPEGTLSTVKGPRGMLAEIEQRKMEAWEQEAARRRAEDQDPEAMRAVLRKYGYKI